MIGVSGKPVSNYLCPDIGTPFQGMIQLLYDQDTGTLADYKSVPVLIKGP